MINLLNNLGLDWQTDLQENLIILTDSVAVGTQHFRVKLPNEGLEHRMVCFFFRFGEVIVDGVNEVDEEVVGVMLLVASELSKPTITGERL